MVLGRYLLLGHVDPTNWAPPSLTLAGPFKPVGARELLELIARTGKGRAR